jgi:hypothetical protein
MFFGPTSKHRQPDQRHWACQRSEAEQHELCRRERLAYCALLG